ncbi:MAG: DNA polymerase/3'-5' exonuclease PolX [Candidatus Omnitrophica bacterium]|nr:DNA polymerase/3'-5' exonuclease PolX [Candidatus Omnitrophota bacterium]
MDNKTVAGIFKEIAKILEIKGENVFRIRAYEKAGRIIEGLSEDIETLAENDTLRELPGIGKDLAEKIQEIIKTGTLKKYQELKKGVPEGVLEMLTIPGLGPRTVKLFYDSLGIDSLAKLEEAVRGGAIMTLPGIREKTQKNILEGIAHVRQSAKTTLLGVALPLAEKILAKVKAVKYVAAAEIAGSLRRRKETVKDIDLLVVSKKPKAVMDECVGLDFVKQVQAKGLTKTSVIEREHGLQVDLRVVDKDSFGAALIYFTGSKAFNIKLRQLAIKRGYKINEYGVFAQEETKKEKISRDEERIFGFFDMQHIAPELREDTGEIEAALAKHLPRLIRLKDVYGDLHVHSEYSDGKASISDIAAGGEALGYEYIAVVDHSQGLKIAGGLDPAQVRKKIDEIKKVNRNHKKIQILSGAEVDIHSDGTLDYPPDVLSGFDVVIAAIHGGFKQTKTQLTKRIVAACKDKHVNIIAHPTGRLMGLRPGYEIDYKEIFKVAADYQVALELNCFPQRLDLDDIHCRAAKTAGIKIALGSDSHSLRQLQNMKYGVFVARRGWLEKEDILNCWPKGELLKWLKK